MRACSFDTDLAQMSEMPASSRLPAVITDASTLSPIATTAVSKSAALSCSSASTSVMSACTVGICDDQRFTSSGSRSTASTSCPIASSVVATALPKRPSPTTSTLRLSAMVTSCKLRVNDEERSGLMVACGRRSAHHDLVGGVAHHVKLLGPAHRVGKRHRAQTPHDHRRGEHVKRRIAAFLRHTHRIAAQAE